MQIKLPNLKTPDTVHRHSNCGTLFECIHITSNKCYKITVKKILTPKSVILFIIKNKTENKCTTTDQGQT